MYSKARLGLTALMVAAAIALPVPTFSAGETVSDVRITRDDTAGSYRRYDGQSDPTTAACSTGRRMQAEPSVAINPRNTNIVVAGSNDYCVAMVAPNGRVWVGYHRSTDGGATWTNSLVPGYPADTSPAGVSAPMHGTCGATGDPTQAFDTDGRLFYGFVCFNASGPLNTSVLVATYDEDGSRYVRSVMVGEGSPANENGFGLFHDKVNLAVDQTAGPTNGNIYVTWSRYSGSSRNPVVLFSRSVDHGATFSRPIRVSPGLGDEIWTDLGVGPDGAVYLVYRTHDLQGPTRNAIHLVRSVDAGRSFGPPRLVATIEPFDSWQFTGASDAWGQIACGDGPFRCPTGLTLPRFGSNPAVAADAAGVHVVWSARVTAGGQAKIFVRRSPDGEHWPTPAAPLDAVATGHQWFADIASADGVITVVFHDSRADTSYAPDLPPGNTAAGKNSGGGVHTFAARSADGGLSWIETRLSSASSNPNWEIYGVRRQPFFGDYIYVSAVPGAVYVVWQDSRDVVPGSDPREHGPDIDTDGFDVLQPCTYVPNDIQAASYSSPSFGDPCLSHGGLDQNIYGARLGVRPDAGGH